MPSSVVESNAQPVADAPATAVAANRAGGWAVQLGAFKSEAEANKLRDRLRAASIATFVDRNGSGAEALWRVRAGPYADRAGAEGARDNIDGKFKLKGMIVSPVNWADYCIIAALAPAIGVVAAFIAGARAGMLLARSGSHGNSTTNWRRV